MRHDEECFLIQKYKLTGGGGGRKENRGRISSEQAGSDSATITVTVQI